MEQQLSNMVDKLHILIVYLLSEDMGQSTLDEIIIMQSLGKNLTNIWQGSFVNIFQGV